MYNSIILAGPTAVGKTDLSIKLAKKLNASIISADSTQVYRRLNIGTAKIKENEMQGINHYLIDVADINENYSLGRYYKEANEVLNSNDDTYILVGGTGLYIQAITDGLTIMPEIDENKRAYLEGLSIEELKKIANVDINNKYRLIRIIEKGNISYNNIKANDRNFLKIFLIRNRENLYDRINKRVDLMFEEGLLEEAKKLFDEYDDINVIGYKELFSYFRNEISLELAKEKIKTASRRYAKRQFTWFKNKGYIEYNLDELTVDEIIHKITKEYLNV